MTKDELIKALDVIAEGDEIYLEDPQSLRAMKPIAALYFGSHHACLGSSYAFVQMVEDSKQTKPPAGEGGREAKEGKVQ